MPITYRQARGGKGERPRRVVRAWPGDADPHNMRELCARIGLCDAPVSLCDQNERTPRIPLITGIGPPFRPPLGTPLRTDFDPYEICKLREKSLDVDVPGR